MSEASDFQRQCDALGKAIEFLRAQRERDVEEGTKKRHDLRDELSTRIQQLGLEQFETREDIGILKGRASQFDALLAMVVGFSEKLGRLSERVDVVYEGSGRGLSMIVQAALTLIAGLIIGWFAKR